MCTAATYKTKDFYFGRTFDNECSYSEQVVITPRHYPFKFMHMGTVDSQSRITRFIMMRSMKRGLAWRD